MSPSDSDPEPVQITAFAFLLFFRHFALDSTNIQRSDLFRQTKISEHLRSTLTQVSGISGVCRVFG